MTTQLPFSSRLRNALLLLTSIAFVCSVALAEDCKVSTKVSEQAEDLYKRALEAYRQDDLAQAGELYEEALQAVGDSKFPLQRARILNDLGMVLRRSGKLGEAEAKLREALTIRKQSLKANDPCIGVSLNNLGDLSLGRNDAAQAEQYFKSALAIAESNPAQPNASLANVLNNIAAMHFQAGDYKKAATYLTRALSTYRRLSPVDEKKVNDIREALFLSYQKLRDYPSFRALYSELVRSKPNWSLASALQVARVMIEKGDALVSGGDLRGAEAMYNRALACLDGFGSSEARALEKTTQENLSALERKIAG